MEKFGNQKTEYLNRLKANKLKQITLIPIRVKGKPSSLMEINPVDAALVLKSIPGLPGERGLKGKKGDPGKAGPIGPIGLIGQEGKRGEPGKRGIDGKRGIQGAKGIIGQIGPKGKRGKNGADGLQGIIGKAGIQGPRGPIGPKGDKGEKGETGERGKFGFMPRHQWRGKQIRFQQSITEWGNWTNIEGPVGNRIQHISNNIEDIRRSEPKYDDYQMVNSDDIIFADATDNTVDIALPLSPEKDQLATVKAINIANTVRIIGTIDDAANFVFLFKDEYRTMLWDGSKWRVLGA